MISHGEIWGNQDNKRQSYYHKSDIYILFTCSRYYSADAAQMLP